MTARTRTKARRRPSGAGMVRQLPSGRWQAMFTGSDGVKRPAPKTFDTKRDAETWLASQVKAVESSTWEAPLEGTTKGGLFKEYAENWIKNRSLTPKSRADYSGFLKNLLPTFGHIPYKDITRKMVREWHDGWGTKTPSARAHSYGLLKAILQTAEDDEDIVVNPCQVKKAANIRRVSKPVILTPAEVNELAAEMPERYRAMVLIAAWCAPRSSEVRELRRRDIDVKRHLVSIERGVTYASGTGMVIGHTKSEAGDREVFIPPFIWPAVKHHLDTLVASGPNALLFPSASDPAKTMNTSTLYKVFYRARDAIGQPTLKWHHLRHTGATHASQIPGTSLAALIKYTGHSTVDAAMIYQHANSDSGKKIMEGQAAAYAAAIAEK